MNKDRWTINAITDRGLQRKDNQDNYYVSSDKRIFLVADGVGGAAHGAQASLLAVTAVQRKFELGAPNYENPEELESWLEAAVNEANLAVLKLKVPNKMHSPATTIIIGARSDEGMVLIAHVGDSRAYLCRKDEAESLTKDHSFVQEMLNNNQLSEEQAWTSPYRNLVTRCLGHDSEVRADFTRVEMQAGDWLILCSDGLSGVMKNQEISQVVNKCDNSGELCELLLQSVMERHAPDNVTIIVTRMDTIASDTKSEELAATSEIKKVKANGTLNLLNLKTRLLMVIEAMHDIIGHHKCYK